MLCVFIQIKKNKEAYFENHLPDPKVQSDDGSSVNCPWRGAFSGFQEIALYWLCVFCSWSPEITHYTSVRFKNKCKFSFIIKILGEKKINQPCPIKWHKSWTEVLCSSESHEETLQCECKTLSWCWPLGKGFKGVSFGCVVSEGQPRGSAFLCKYTYDMPCVSQLIIEIKCRTNYWVKVAWNNNNMSLKNICMRDREEHQTKGNTPVKRCQYVGQSFWSSCPYKWWRACCRLCWRTWTEPHLSAHWWTAQGSWSPAPEHRASTP